MLVNTREDIGTGNDSQDMVTVALKIKLDTLTSKRDLTADEIVKVRYHFALVVSEIMNFSSDIKRFCFRALYTPSVDFS